MADEKDQSGTAPTPAPEKGDKPTKPKKVYKLRKRKGAPPAKPAEGTGEPSFLGDLKDALMAAEMGRTEDKELEQLRERFQVHDEGTATWAAGKIVMWAAEIKRRKEQSKLYVEEAEKNLTRMEYLFKGQLEIWARKNLPVGKKNIKLPSATLKFSPTQEKLDIVDADRVKTWATVNCPDALDTQVMVLLQVLKDHYDKNRDDVPTGCEVVPAGENFNIKG
jgi:hypothetical protein